jgi:mRNA-degrading endonuclease RelE of RelBE toxin-antitoxin system
MQVAFRHSFVRDLRRLRRKTLRQRVRAVIEHVEQATDLLEIPNVRRLTGDGLYYRILVWEIIELASRLSRTS